MTPDILRTQIAETVDQRRHNERRFPLDLSLMAGTGVLTPLLAAASLSSAEEMAQKAGVLLLAAGTVAFLASVRATCVRMGNIEDLTAQEQRYGMDLYRLEEQI